MRETILGNHIRKVPSVAVGCMRLSEKSKDEMNHFIHAALEQGAYFFDHADIYGGGMRDNTTYVRNIKKYLLAALYNAPTTINSYYSSLVQHDMYGDGQRGRG